MPHLVARQALSAPKVFRVVARPPTCSRLIHTSLPLANANNTGSTAPAAGDPLEDPKKAGDGFLGVSVVSSISDSSLPNHILPHYVVVFVYR